MVRSNGKNKYGNRRTAIDGITFDSRTEANRYAELKMLEKAGAISDLMLQVPYELQPSFMNNETGRKERAIKYVADFVYKDDHGKEIIEDVKSDATRLNPVYRIKKKMMAYRGWYIREV